MNIFNKKSILIVTPFDGRNKFVTINAAHNHMRMYPYNVDTIQTEQPLISFGTWNAPLSNLWP